MEVQKLDLISIRKCLEKHSGKRELNIFIENVIDDIVLNGLDANFDYKFFQGLKINMAYLNKYLDNPSRNFELLLYNLVLLEIEPKEQIKNLALKKCKWHELINLCQKELISVEEYEEVLLNSLPYANYEAIFTFDINLSKLKKQVYEDTLEDNFNYGYYLLFPVLIANTEYDKYNLAFSKKLVNNSSNEINYLIIETLRFFLKTHYDASIKDLDKIILLNYEYIVSNRPDILLIYINYRNRLLDYESNMTVLIENYIESEDSRILFNDIVEGKITDVAYVLKESKRKIPLNNIINGWLKNNNSLAVATYINYFLSYQDYELGEKLDQRYLSYKKKDGGSKK